MMERHEHTNPWADKLQEVPLPDANDSWSAMAALLDKEMPVARPQDRRRWLLLVLLLLLLIGVCNCPRLGHRYQSAQSGPSQSGSISTSPSPSSPSADSPSTAGHPVPAGTASGLPNPQPPTDETGPAPGPVSGSPDGSSGRSTEGHPDHNKDGLSDPNVPAKTGPGVVVPRTSSRRSSKPGTPAIAGVAVFADTGEITTAVSVTRGKKTGKGKLTRGKTLMGTPDSQLPGTPGNKLPKSPGNKLPERPDKDLTVTSARKAAGPSTPKPADSVGKKPDPSTSKPADVVGEKLDSASKKPGAPTTKNPAPAGKKTGAPAAKKPDPTGKKPAESADKKKADKDKPGEEDDVKGLVVGIGLNQFFSVGQQQKSDYNSGGTTGGIGDYIPVPMARYYFSRKLYVQLEAQFNTPQYTKKDLVGGLSKADTLSPGRVQQNSVIIKKLFYFNLPLSIHYSPLKNLYLGAGLQYSRLSNGVGVLQNRVITTGASDSIKSATVYNIKGDSVYQKMRTHEFRVLFDINYTYKRFILGVRYNQALSKFLDVRLSDTKITQARNSSLQLYARYILWDHRKKKVSPSK